MPRGVRTDRISERDLEVLRYVGRFGIVPRQAVAVWAGTGRTVTLTRERRLRISGLISVLPPVGSVGPFSIATRAGLRLCELYELRPASFSYAEAIHQARCALLGAQLERAGESVLSEREIAMEERLAKRRIYSAQLPRGSQHRPDLIRLTTEGPEAIEVELSSKGASRLDLLLRSWRRAVVERKVRGILYLCTSETRRAVERSIARTSTQAQVRVEPLEPEHALPLP
jgi:hypothetical protein